jgi:hypothetical protein
VRSAGERLGWRERARGGARELAVCEGAGRPEQSAGAERSAGAGRTGAGVARGAGMRVELRRGARDSDIRDLLSPSKRRRSRQAAAARGCGAALESWQSA